MKFSSDQSWVKDPETTCPCEEENCAWWNEYFGKCSIAVDSYLKGIETHRQEVKEYMRNR